MKTHLRLSGIEMDSHYNNAGDGDVGGMKRQRFQEAASERMTRGKCK